jgi:predicted amidohydrolase
MRVAVVQMNSTSERSHNVERALALIDHAVDRGATFVLLPEYMTYRGAYDGFAGASEPIPGPTSERLAASARRHSIYLHGGSLIERTAQPDRFYNTSLLFDPQGELIARYRKIHLFDVRVDDAVIDTESRIIRAGDTLVTVDVAGFKIGMSICYDLRFPEMYCALSAAGAEVLVVPSAFTAYTGKSHWEILLRARAIENFAYVLAPAQHGPGEGDNLCYGHSMIIEPWGEILAAASDGDQVVVADLDRNQVIRRRQQIPVFHARRSEIYG